MTSMNPTKMEIPIDKIQISINDPDLIQTKNPFLLELVQSKLNIYTNIFRNHAKYMTQHKYAKTFKELKAEDRIEIHDKKILSDEYKDARMSAPWHICLPFLTKGVMRLQRTNPIWLYFELTDADIEHRKIRMEFEYYEYNEPASCLNKNAQWIATFAFSDTVRMGCELTIECYIDYLESLTVFLEDVRKPESEIRLNQPEQELIKLMIDKLNSNREKEKRSGKFPKRANDLTMLFLKAIADINFLMMLKKEQKAEDQNPAEPENQYDTPAKKRPKTKKQRKQPNVNIQIIDGVNVRLSKHSPTKYKNGRIRNHYTDQWQVSGHFRKLKSGKIIYINPYVKGPGRKLENEEPKPVKHRQKIYKTTADKQSMPDMDDT